MEWSSGNYKMSNHRTLPSGNLAYKMLLWKGIFACLRSKTYQDSSITTLRSPSLSKLQAGFQKRPTNENCGWGGGRGCWSRQDNSHWSFNWGACEPLYTREIELIQDRMREFWKFRDISRSYMLINGHRDRTFYQFPFFHDLPCSSMGPSSQI